MVRLAAGALPAEALAVPMGEGVARAAGYAGQALSENTRRRAGFRQLAHQGLQRRRGVGDRAVLADFAALPCVGQSHRHRCLVHIKTDVGDRLSMIRLRYV